MNPANELQDRAMLVTLTISQWTNRKHDKSVSSEVERTHAAKDAGRYNKMLIDKAALEPISKIASAARECHYRMTLPWGKNGEWLLPAALFMDYAEQMRGYKAQFETAVRAFVAQYPTLVQAARNRLGTMYDALDYPPSSEIISKFAMTTEITPVPSANDFRVGLNAEIVGSIRHEITETVMNRQQDAVKALAARVKDVVGRIHERLSDEDKKFRDSLIGNARDLIEVLPSLNITNDAGINALHAELQTLLVAPETLRTNAQIRNNVADKAAEILERMKGYAFA